MRCGDQNRKFCDNVSSVLNGYWKKERDREQRKKKEHPYVDLSVCGVCKFHVLSMILVSPYLRKNAKEQQNPYKHSRDNQNKAVFCVDRSRWLNLETRQLNGSERLAEYWTAAL